MKRFLPFLIGLFLTPCLLQARQAKVFYENGRWIKGDVQFQTDESGREIAVIALPSGSLILSKSEIKNIVYNSYQKPKNNRFLDALEKTRIDPEPMASPTPYDDYIQMASSKMRMDPHLVKAVIRQESNFNSRDVSHKGAQGLMQLMPETAKGLGVKNSFDPYQNIHGGTLYLKYMLETFDGDLKKALAAYNAGPGAVQKYGAVPPYRETRDYVKKVLRYYEMYRGSKLFAFQDKNGSLVFTDREVVP